MSEQLPRWRSRQIVHAGTILRVDAVGDPITSYRIHVQTDGAGVVTHECPAGWLAGDGAAGIIGYYARQHPEGTYEYWAPHQFEAQFEKLAAG